MGVRRLDNVLIVVDDLEAATAFFTEIGLEEVGRQQVQGRWVDSVVGLDGVVSDIVMLQTPDGHGRIELSRFVTPQAVRLEPEDAPSNALGYRRVMFAVTELDELVARLERIGASLVREVAQYEDVYRLCFVRGPEGIVVGLAEEL